jgi:23S rRNA pseudouridine2604 synthase
MQENIRLSKLMAQRGICSRREADDFIARGWVLVDGVPMNELGVKVRPDQEIRLASEAQSLRDDRVTVLLNKPIGIVSAQAEDGYTPAISLINPKNRFSGDASGITFRPEHRRGLAVAGRLDIDSHGLLVLTQDGRIARRLIAPDSDIEKEYRVKVHGEITPKTIERLTHGLHLDKRPLKPATVEMLAPGRLRFILQEGRKRQIRRMCELVGLQVHDLERIRIGDIRLDNLPYGQWRYLAPGETF